MKFETKFLKIYNTTSKTYQKLPVKVKLPYKEWTHKELIEEINMIQVEKDYILNENKQLKLDAERVKSMFNELFRTDEILSKIKQIERRLNDNE